MSFALSMARLIAKREHEEHEDDAPSETNPGDGRYSKGDLAQAPAQPVKP